MSGTVKVFALRDHRTKLPLSLLVEALGVSFVLDAACPECGEGMPKDVDPERSEVMGLCCRCERTTDLWALRRTEAA